jgi:hypothetical protein
LTTRYPRAQEYHQQHCSTYHRFSPRLFDQQLRECRARALSGERARYRKQAAQAPCSESLLRDVSFGHRELRLLRWRGGGESRMVMVRLRQLFFSLDPGELALAVDGYRHRRKAVDGRAFGVLAGKLANDWRGRRGLRR